MKYVKLSLIAVLATFNFGIASADVIGIGVTKGGSVNRMGTAIAKVVSSHSGSQMRPVVRASTQQLVPEVNSGKLKFAMGNMMQINMALAGTGMSKGIKYENLRMVGTMIPFRWGIAVRNDSNIKKMTDLKGKRIPHGHDAGPLFHFLYVGVLASAGLTYDDVERIPVVLFKEGWNKFKQGKADVALTGVGSGIMEDMNATVPSGVRFLPFDGLPAPKKLLFDHTASNLVDVDPGKGLAGVITTTKLAVYDYTLYASKMTPNGDVYKVVKALYEHGEELKEVGGVFRRGFSPKNMSKDQKIAYHPGAVKFYKEAGSWNR